MESQKFITRAGLAPSIKVGLPYEITTGDAEKFLQDQVNAVVHKYVLPNSGGKLSDWKITLYTSDVSKKFLPFILVVPDAALPAKEDKDDQVENIFQIKNFDRTRLINKDFYSKFLSAYMYDKTDTALFESSTWRYRYNLTRSQSSALKGMVNPKTVPFDNGRTKKTIVMLDPIRVFHAMLKIDGDPRDFQVELSEWKKQEIGKYNFIVMRYLKNKGHHNSYYKMMINELNARVSGGN